jgi:hypothetical protein
MYGICDRLVFHANQLVSLLGTTSFSNFFQRMQRVVSPRAATPPVLG